jgi:hypothetical protein
LKPREPALDLRDAIRGISEYIATTETAKHRTFSLVSSVFLADQKVRVISSDRTDFLAILSSRIHVLFSISKGGWQGVGNDPVYQHTQTFDPFPFPAGPMLPQSDVIIRQERLSDLGKRLETFRKQRLAEHSFLTMTGLYNALERLRELENGCDVEPLTDAERDVHQAGLISVLKELHDDIDRAVLTSYGWTDLIPALVGKPGATLSSLHKTNAQEKAEEELLTRLVALNHERAVEEKRGVVRWLRSDYQIPKLGVKAPKPKSEHVGMLDVELPDVAERPKWPTDGLEQIRLVRDLLAKTSSDPARCHRYRV